MADDGTRTPVRVHAKLLVVDDQWATVGSCNLHRFSLTGNSERHASFPDAPLARQLRLRLFEKHVRERTGGLDDIAALRRFAEVAGANRRRWDAGDDGRPGLAFRL